MKYETPTTEVILFDNADIITISSGKDKTDPYGNDQDW